MTHIWKNLVTNSKNIASHRLFLPTLYNLYTSDLPEPTPSTEYIAFADDISQIAFTDFNHRFVARKTVQAIEQINAFENKWKIKTNPNKFTIIPISRKKTTDIIVNNEQLRYSSTGKVLGLNFNPQGIIPQVKVRTAIAKNNLSKLHRFSNLSQRNKTKLYNSLVRSALIYPPVPLNILSNTQMLEMQRIQNKALRFITNTSIQDRIPSRQLHNQLNIPPINIYVHSLAKTIWNKIEHQMPEKYQELRNNNNHNNQYRFPSSLQISLNPLPPPIYS